jgi:hypothetical protein
MSCDRVFKIPSESNIFKKLKKMVEVEGENDLTVQLITQVLFENAPLVRLQHRRLSKFADRVSQLVSFCLNVEANPQHEYEAATESTKAPSASSFESFEFNHSSSTQSCRRRPQTLPNYLQQPPWHEILIQERMPSLQLNSLRPKVLRVLTLVLSTLPLLMAVPLLY